jgi:hypothetical protein
MDLEEWNDGRVEEWNDGILNFNGYRLQLLIMACGGKDIL